MKITLIPFTLLLGLCFVSSPSLHSTSPNCPNTPSNSPPMEITTNNNAILAQALRFIATEATRGAVMKGAQDLLEIAVENLGDWYIGGNAPDEVPHIIEQGNQLSITISHFLKCQICNRVAHTLTENTPYYPTIPKLAASSVVSSEANETVGNILIMNANGINGSAGRLSRYLSKQVPQLNITVGESWYGEGLLRAKNSVIYHISSEHEQLANHIARKIMSGTQRIRTYQKVIPHLRMSGYDVVIFVGEETY